MQGLQITGVPGMAIAVVFQNEWRFAYCGTSNVADQTPIDATTVFPIASKVHSVFRTLLKSAGLKPSGGRWPRIHECRHTFAVRALESSPTGRQRIGQHMLALATYLGHVNIDATYWYLESTPELLGEIAVVAESFMQRGRP
jgi:integrase